MQTPKVIMDTIRAGGNVIINSKSVPPPVLLEIATLAAEAGRTVTIRDAAQLMPAAMAEIARAGSGYATFDFT